MTISKVRFYDFGPVFDLIRIGVVPSPLIARSVALAQCREDIIKRDELEVQRRLLARCKFFLWAMCCTKNPCLSFLPISDEKTTFRTVS